MWLDGAEIKSASPFTANAISANPCGVSRILAANAAFAKEFLIDDDSLVNRQVQMMLAKEPLWD